MDQSGNESKWSELPSDLLIKIARVVSTTPAITFSCKLQILQFRAVCNSWRLVLPLENTYINSLVSDKPPIPVMAPPPYVVPFYCSKLRDLGREPNRLLCIVSSTTYIFQSLEDPFAVHLLTVDHLSNEPGKVYCRNPLLVTLDRSSTWNVNAPRSVNLLDYRVSIVAEEYCLRYLSEANGVLELPVSCESFGKKAVLIRNSELEVEKDGVAIVLLDGGVLGEYHFRERSWKIIYDGKKSKCSDVIRTEDGCIIIDHKANAFYAKYDFDSRALIQKQLALEILGSRIKRKRLVLNSDDGNLYLVVEHSNESCFTAYTLSECQKYWTACDGIPDWILFVGSDISFSVKAEAVPGICTGHCIYSSVDSFPLYQHHVFSETKYPPCVFYIGLKQAGLLSQSRHDSGYHYNPICSSPGEWLELNQPTPSRPSQNSIEHVVQVEAAENSEGYYSLLRKDENVLEGLVQPSLGIDDDLDGSQHSQGTQVLKGKGERIAAEHVVRNETVNSSGDYPIPPEAENNDPGWRIPSLETSNPCGSPGKQAVVGKRKRVAVDSDRSESSNQPQPKSRKHALCQSSAEHSESDEVLLDSLQKLSACIMKLTNNPVQIQPDPAGGSIRGAIQDLDSLLNIVVGSDFYFSAVSLLLKKENREQYMSFGDGYIKYKWLQYMLRNS